MFKALILKYVQVHQSSRKFLFHLFHRFLPTHPSDTSKDKACILDKILQKQKCYYVIISSQVLELKI